MVKKYLFLVIFLILIVGDRVYSKDKIVAVILAANVEKFKVAYTELKKNLSEKRKDSQIQIVLSTPNPDLGSWANALKRAEGMDVNLIIAFGAPLAYVAIKEKISIPLIYVDVYEKNIFDAIKNQQMTGVYNSIPISTVIKNLKLIKNFKKLHVLYCPYEKESEIQAKKIKEMYIQENFKVELHSLKTSQEIYNIKVDNSDAIFVTSSVVLETNMTKIADYAIEKEIPLVGISETVTSGGGLMCVAPDPKGQGRILSDFLVTYLETKILPRSEQVKDVNFVINIKTAKKINVTIPLVVLNNVTKVIR